MGKVTYGGSVPAHDPRYKEGWSVKTGSRLKRGSNKPIATAPRTSSTASEEEGAKEPGPVQAEVATR